VATTTTRLITFKEYEKIPSPPGGVYELHHGELFTVTYPLHPHARAKRQLRRLLEAAAGNTGVVHTEMPYRPLPEYECWGADIAYLTKARWDSIDRYLMGAPELVVEVLSPSNARTEIDEKRKLCLENGSREFWTVNTKTRQVEVSTPGGGSVTYSSGEQIPLFFGGSLAVDEIFS
jgi:Uma2 family endonuclease